MTSPRTNQDIINENLLKAEELMGKIDTFKNSIKQSEEMTEDERKIVKQQVLFAAKQIKIVNDHLIKINKDITGSLTKSQQDQIVAAKQKMTNLSNEINVIRNNNADKQKEQSLDKNDNNPDEKHINDFKPYLEEVNKKFRLFGYDNANNKIIERKRIEVREIAASNNDNKFKQVANYYCAIDASKTPKGVSNRALERYFENATNQGKIPGEIESCHPKAFVLGTKYYLDRAAHAKTVSEQDKFKSMAKNCINSLKKYPTLPDDNLKKIFNGNDIYEAKEQINSLEKLYNQKSASVKFQEKVENFTNRLKR